MKNNLKWYNIRPIIYGYIAHQHAMEKSLNESLFWWMNFCSKCGHPVEKVLKEIKYYDDAPTEYYQLRNEMSKFYYCEHCKKIIDVKNIKTAQSKFHEYATKFGYSRDCHGYHKEEFQ